METATGSSDGGENMNFADIPLQSPSGNSGDEALGEWEDEQGIEDAADPLRTSWLSAFCRLGNSTLASGREPIGVAAEPEGVGGIAVLRGISVKF